MQGGYHLRLWALVLMATIIAREAESVSDVDLRIAERRAIPHYIRHSYEYPDIDIKAIMMQRGITVPKAHHTTSQRPHYSSVHQRPLPVHRNFPWKQYSKLAAQSNHILPRGNYYFMKKQMKHFNKNYLLNGKRHQKMGKF